MNMYLEQMSKLPHGILNTYIHDKHKWATIFVLDALQMTSNIIAFYTKENGLEDDLEIHLIY